MIAEGEHIVLIAQASKIAIQLELLLEKRVRSMPKEL
eukprot:XP_001710039.1 Hypothetical protein GL50803_8607 [Giardia lamblia ATCC 50803]